MLIKNGLIVSPGNQLEQPADLRIRNGIIETIAAANSLTAEPDEQVLDASSLVIAPGLIDIHVHFRDPGLTYKEDLHTGAMAAAAEGRGGDAGHAPARREARFGAAGGEKRP